MFDLTQAEDPRAFQGNAFQAHVASGNLTGKRICLILDEPTDGLEPAATEDELRELVAIAGTSGTTMFFSSHQPADVELMADHIGIIDQWRVWGTPIASVASWSLANFTPLAAFAEN